MCSNGKEGFFSSINRMYGGRYKRIMKDWIDYNFKLCLVKQQRRFLIRCRSYDIVPPHIYNLKISITLNNLHRNRKFNNLKKDFQFKLLNLEIREVHGRMNFLKLKIQNLEKLLHLKLPNDLVENFTSSNYNRFNNYNRKVVLKLKNKFNRIRAIQNSRVTDIFNTDKSKWITNLCSIDIPESVMNVLSLGEKFGLPANLSDSRERVELIVNFVKNFEASTPKLPERIVDKARSMVVNSLCRNLSGNNHLSHFDKYINREVKKCKKVLKNNPEIFVTKADKGQVTVVMYRSVYVDKMTQMLEDTETYKPVKTNPLSKMNSKLNNLIKGWLDCKAIDEWRYKCLKCTNGNLPRCYGLPKIHKRDVPLRIVMSSVGSPLYDVAKFLHNILNISIKKLISHVKDSWSFVSHIKEKSISLDEIMVSSDVTSLFTNLPKELILRRIENRWLDIEKNTKLSLPQLINAVELLLSSAYFSYNDKYYSQIYGSPMGSPLSPILADIVLDDLETYCLQKFDFSIHTYYRYVDDIFMIIPATKLISLLDVFNNYHPRLKFTYEVEVNSSLNFLDVSVMRMNGKLTTNWFRKPTFSGRYINFLSNHYNIS